MPDCEYIDAKPFRPIGIPKLAQSKEGTIPGGNPGEDPNF